MFPRRLLVKLFQCRKDGKKIFPTILQRLQLYTLCQLVWNLFSWMHRRGVCVCKRVCFYNPDWWRIHKFQVYLSSRRVSLTDLSHWPVSTVYDNGSRSILIMNRFHFFYFFGLPMLPSDLPSLLTFRLSGREILHKAQKSRRESNINVPFRKSGSIMNCGCTS